MKLHVPLLVAGLFTGCASLYATSENILTNPGFESGNFGGWTAGSDSPIFGVGLDGINIAGDEFGQGLSNVRSGNYAAFAQVKGNPAKVLTLSQTLDVLPGQDVDVGFFVGHGESIPLGFSLGLGIASGVTQILVDGVPLTLAPNNAEIPGGQSPADFLQVSASFNTGARDQLTLTFKLDGSGRGFAINSFDDFFALTEPASVAQAPVTQTPDAGQTAILLLAATGVLICSRKASTASRP
jgi:hypothetical protein